MVEKPTQRANPLPSLFHNRWTVPCLAILDAKGGGAKLVTLCKKLGASRASLKRALATLIGIGLVQRNPGYGHPLRPEYVLTVPGKQVAKVCVKLVRTLERLDIEEVGARKWSLPVAHALATVGGRFNGLRAALEGITPRALSTALRDLQQAGLVERLLVDDAPPHTEYRLTPAGRLLTPAVSSLAEVSAAPR